MRAKCHVQGSTDLEEAPVIAGGCRMASEAFKVGYENTHTCQPPFGSGAAAMVHSISDGGHLYRAMDKLTEALRE